MTWVLPVGRLLPAVYSLRVDDGGEDLAVVCRSCGSRVSPYITECPYCGNRLRKRAPKLGSREDPARRAEKRRKRSERRSAAQRLSDPSRSIDRRPSAVVALTLASVVVSAIVRSRILLPSDVVPIGPLGDQRWKILTAPFVHLDVSSGFVILALFVLFGIWIEALLGHVVVILLWLAAGTGSAWLATLDGFHFAAGALGPAVAVVVARGFCAVESRRDGEEDDVIGLSVALIVLLSLPLLAPVGSGASWLSIGAGAFVGLAVGSLGVVKQRADRSG